MVPVDASHPHPASIPIDTLRTNIGNAKLDGLQEDLHMSNAQYNASLTIFFVSYSVFEPLTNVLLKRMRPSIFIPIIMILWVRPRRRFRPSSS